MYSLQCLNLLNKGKPVDFLASGWLTLDLVIQFVVKERAFYQKKEHTLILPTKWLLNTYTLFKKKNHGYYLWSPVLLPLYLLGHLRHPDHLGIERRLSPLPSLYVKWSFNPTLQSRNKLSPVLQMNKLRCGQRSSHYPKVTKWRDLHSNPGHPLGHLRVRQIPSEMFSTRLFKANDYSVSHWCVFVCIYIYTLILYFCSFPFFYFNTVEA